MKTGALLLIGLSACSGRPQNLVKADSTAKQAPVPHVTPAPTPVTPPNSTAVLPPMPRYPEATKGHMAVVSAGPAGSEAITRDWPADAGFCETPSRLLVKSELVGSGGTILLFALPENGVATYSIALPNRTIPSPPAAMAGLQVYSKTGPLAYQAIEGSAELTTYGSTVSGRFGLTLRELNRTDRLRYAGSFRELPVARLDSIRCASVAGLGTPQN